VSEISSLYIYKIYLKFIKKRLRNELLVELKLQNEPSINALISAEKPQIIRWVARNTLFKKPS
jgi:hypothetical protein